MPRLVPVDYDPFSGEPLPATVPVDHDPWAKDSWAEAGIVGDVGAASARLRADEAQRRAAVGGLTRRWTLPGRVSAGVQPATPGVWTEEDEFRRRQLEEEAQRWGPEQATAMIGGGVPGAERGALGAAGGGIKAYHGSPYDFERFDISKVGTGEGAQAYGHGLYFAEKEATAKSYKDAPRVTDMDWPVISTKFTPAGESSQIGRVPAWVARGAESSPARAKEILDDFRNRAAEMEKEGHWNTQGIKDIVGYLEAVKAGDAYFSKPGHMYEVNIAADPEHFLDWDKPLREQSAKAKEALQPLVQAELDLLKRARTSGVERNDLRDALESGSMRASDLYQRQRRAPEVSEQLRQAGVPGIKYLDQGSRRSPAEIKAEIADIESAVFKARQNPVTGQRIADLEAELAANTGKGTHNYVVFDDKLIDVLKKYGLAGLIAGGVAHFKTQPVDHDPFAAEQ